MADRMQSGKLLAVIGDEVRAEHFIDQGFVMIRRISWLRPQDTCTGFLLGGIGELNSKRQPNFLVVNKGRVCELCVCLRCGGRGGGIQILVLPAVCKHLSWWVLNAAASVAARVVGALLKAFEWTIV